jgi:hypothetical protein
MKTLLISSGGAVPLLLGTIKDCFNWVSWDTPGHGTYPADIARSKVQYILDVFPDCLEEVPTISFSPTYCNAPITLIGGFSMGVSLLLEGRHLDITCGIPSDINNYLGGSIPRGPITATYHLCLYDVGRSTWYDGSCKCTYLVPHIHPSELSLSDDGTGSFSFEDMLGGALCYHLEGTEPRHLLREAMRTMGHLPHQFLNTTSITHGRR